MKKLIKRLEEQMNDTGVTKDTSCFDGLLSKMQDSQDFKRGDVLIRGWLDGCVDYCRFKEFIKDNECLQNHFYDDGYYYSIYKNGKVDNFSGLENVAVNYNNSESLKFNWRKATKEEIDKLNKLLGKVEENKELEEAINHLKIKINISPFFKSEKGKRTRKSIETILKHLDK